MATELDTDLVPLVTELLPEFGKDATFEVVTKAYDETTGRATPTGATSVVRKVTPPGPVSRRFGGDDSRVQSGGDVAVQSELECYLGAGGLTFTPSPGQKVTLDSDAYIITTVEPVYTGELVAIYRLVMRR